jgi:hypothetical protein
MNKLVLIALIGLLALASATKVTYKSKVKQDNCTQEPDADGWYYCTWADDYGSCDDKWRYDDASGTSESENYCTWDNGDGSNSTSYNYYMSTWSDDGSSNGHSTWRNEYDNYTSEGSCQDWSWYDQETYESSGGSSCWGFDSEGGDWNSWSEYWYGADGDFSKSCWSNEDGTEDCWTCEGHYDDNGNYENECYEGHEHEHEEDGDCEDDETHGDEHVQQLHESASIVAELSFQCGCGSDSGIEWANWDGEDYHCGTVCEVEEHIIDPLWASGLLD